MMQRLSLNKTLLRKEFRDQRWLFLSYFFVMSYPAIIYPIIFWLTLPTPYNELDWTYLTWLNDAHRLVSGGEPFAMILSIFIAVGAGVMMLTNDRDGRTIEFLAALPVSRKEIITAKFAAGAGFFIGTIGLNVLVLMLWDLFFGDVHYNSIEAVEWGIQFLGVLLGLYSVSFLMSTVAGNRLAAGMLAMMATFGTHLLVAKFNEWFLPADRSLEPSLFDYFSVLNYLPSVSIQDGNGWPYLAFALMCAFSLLCYCLSVKLFERNPFENNGRFSVFYRWSLPLLVLFFALVLMLVVNWM